MVAALLIAVGTLLAVVVVLIGRLIAPPVVYRGPDRRRRGPAILSVDPVMVEPPVVCPWRLAR